MSRKDKVMGSRSLGRDPEVGAGDKDVVMGSGGCGYGVAVTRKSLGHPDEGKVMGSRALGGDPSVPVGTRTPNVRGGEPRHCPEVSRAASGLSPQRGGGMERGGKRFWGRTVVLGPSGAASSLPPVLRCHRVPNACHGVPPPRRLPPG